MIPVIPSNDYFLKVLLEEKQKEEEIEKMKEKISQLIQDAVIRTRKEVSVFNIFKIQNFTN